MYFYAYNEDRVLKIIESRLKKHKNKNFAEKMVNFPLKFRFWQSTTKHSNRISLEFFSFGTPLLGASISFSWSSLSYPATISFGSKRRMRRFLLKTIMPLYLYLSGIKLMIIWLMNWWLTFVLVSDLDWL